MAPPGFEDYSAESLLCWEEGLHCDGVQQQRRDDLLVHRKNSLRGEPDMAGLQTQTTSDLQEAIALLIQREAFHRPHPDYIKAFDADSRRKALSWIFKVPGFYNFGPLTATLAANYFDRFLSLHKFWTWKAWMIQLVSVACISLAAKIEETEVPPLLDLQVAPDFFFEPKTIERMELLVLATLEWRVSSVTPFSYIDYFLCKCDVVWNARYSIIERTSEFILSAVQEFSFLSHRPSSIAVAASLCAIQEMIPQQATYYKRMLFTLLPRDVQESSERCFVLMVDLFHDAPSVGLRYEPCRDSVPRSPRGVLDATFSCDSESTAKSSSCPPNVHISSSQVVKKQVVQ